MQMPIEWENPREVSVTQRGIRRGPSIAEAFWAFHESRPDVYALLVLLAREVKATGQARYGMKALFERARWHYVIERRELGFVLNNNYTSHYARLIAQCEPDLEGFFELRRLRSE